MRWYMTHVVVSSDTYCDFYLDPVVSCFPSFVVLTRIDLQDLTVFPFDKTGTWFVAWGYLEKRWDEYVKSCHCILFIPASLLVVASSSH
jgi:hypothetical protein